MDAKNPPSKRSSVDDRESYREGFRRMNGISPFPAPCDSPWCHCRSLTMVAQQPSSARAIYQYIFALLLYICIYTYICVYVCIHVQAVRSRWKNTDHFLAFSLGQRHFTDIFHPSPSLAPSLFPRVSRRGVDRPGMQSTFQGRVGT